MDISVVIVNYKTPQLLKACVDSLYKYTRGCTFEVLVVDNDSKDESEVLITSNYPDVIWMDMGFNAGFGKANNKAINVAKGEYVLLLNSDTELYEDALGETLKHYKELQQKHKKVGLLGCKLMYQDQRLQSSCFYYWAGLRELIEEHPIGIKVLQHWLKIPKLRNRDRFSRLEENHEVTWLGVPFALVKSEVIKANQFDENFFMYSEDEELNLRLSKSGFKHFYYPGVGVYHHIGASSSSNTIRQKQIFYSKILFVYKGRSKFYYWLYIKFLKSMFKWNDKLNNQKSEELRWVEDCDQLIRVVIKSGKALNLYF